MRKLLQQAIAQIDELPEEQQDAVARNLINVVSHAIAAEQDYKLNHKGSSPGSAGGQRKFDSSGGESRVPTDETSHREPPKRTKGSSIDGRI